MHFAAFAYVGESVTDPAKYYQNNVVGTLSLMEAMRAAGVSRIVFSSTCATYGEPEEVPDPREPAAAADQPLRIHQARHRARPGRLRPRLRLGLRRPPLLQRGRRLGRRRPRRGPRPRDSPDSRWSSRSRSASESTSRSSATSSRRRMARVFATTSTSTTWPPRTWPRSMRLERGVELKLNLGTGQGSSVSEVIETCRKVTGHPIPAVVTGPRAGDPPALVADAQPGPPRAGLGAAIHDDHADHRDRLAMAQGPSPRVRGSAVDPDRSSRNARARHVVCQL